MSFSSSYPSSPPEPSSASGLRPRRSRRASLSKGSLAPSQSDGYDYGQPPEPDGPDPFSQPLPPVFDDVDDLSYEESDAGDERWKGKDKDLDDGSSLIFRERGPRLRQAGPSHEDEESDELESRPNKFNGPSGTWLGWTQRERQEITALDKLRARDLSAHLYNAFALKRRAKRLATQHANGGAHNYNEQQTDPLFVPPKGWTAWPMLPSVVPRVDENRFRDESDVWTMRMKPDSSPSAELEECVIAQMLNAAKERLNEREWSSDPDTYRRHESRLRIARASTHSNDGRASGANPPVLGEETGVDSEDEATSAPTLKPVPLADDDRARTILRPAARHMLTRLDELLVGLHQARGAYVATSSGLQEEPETEEDSEGESPRKKRRLSAASVTPSDAEDDSEQNEMQESDASPVPLKPQSSSVTRNRIKGKSKGGSKPQAERKSSRQRAPGQRDWSDVLGLASIIGCSQHAVMSAARRCAEVFEEDMAFRSLDEGHLELERTGDEHPVWKYTEDAREGTDTARTQRTANETAIPDYIGKLKEYAKFCPVVECPRHTKGFSRTWNLNKHLKAKHPEILREKTDIKSNPESGNCD